MSIPDYQTIMLPLLQLLGDGEEHHMRELTEMVSDHFELSDTERQERLPSGQSTVIANRVGWAKTYLKNAGLSEQPRRGIARRTEEGNKVVREGLSRIDSKWLEKYPSYVAFRNRRKDDEDLATSVTELVGDDDASTPEEILEGAFETLQDALAGELLEQVKSVSPQFFERMVVELLVAMGYGGSIEDAGRAVGRTGDGGIDGIIKEDKLGLDVVCVQAKRWDSNTVGRPAVQAFAGSMEPHRAKKGVFITTSTFSNDAKLYVPQAERRIVLIDGKRLASLLIEHNVGVTAYRSFDLKRVDTDFFEE
jgi:restriction system protein